MKSRSYVLDIRRADVAPQIWRAVCAIPVGLSRRYGNVARNLGGPNAVRAVADACAAQALSLAIPCLSVMRGDDSISGLLWSAERKRALRTEALTVALAA